MKIVIFNWRDPWDPKAGGAERVTLKHALAWVKVGHSVTWISGSYKKAKSEQIKDGIHYYRSGLSQTLFLRAWFIYWQKFHGQFDIVIDQVHGLPMFSPIWASKSKRLVLVHEVAKEIWSEMFPFPIAQIGRLIESTLFPFLYKREQFWVDCDSVATDVHKLGIPMNNITVIPCAIDTPPKVIGKKEEVLTCIFIARLVKMKGIEYAIQTFAKIRQENPQAKLWVVGEGANSYVAGLKMRIKSLRLRSGVKFWGKVSEMKKYELMRKAHFLLHTSIREGFGLTVLEAESQKTPTACFKVSALQDLVMNEYNGLIVPFAHTDTLAQEVLRTYADKQKFSEMKKKAFQHGKLFHWGKFTQQSLELLRKVAGDR